MTDPLPATAVAGNRTGASSGPSRRGRALDLKVSGYLIPAIKRLPGLIHFYVGVSPEGSIVHVRVWDTDTHRRTGSSYGDER